MDTQHATHTRDETQANDSSQAGVVDSLEGMGYATKPGKKAQPEFDETAYDAAFAAAKEFSKKELSVYQMNVWYQMGELVITQLPFVRKVKGVLKYWAPPAYKGTDGRTFGAQEAAYYVGMRYGEMLRVAVRQGGAASEGYAKRVIKAAYAEYNATRNPGQLVSGFICQIENATFAGMTAFKFTS